MPLKPTLWRTCRALANRPRLRLLYTVWRQPNQTVSDLAHRMRMPLPTASQYLRHLNARGLIQARRSSKWVSYCVAADPYHPDAEELVRALKTAFSAGVKSLDELYRLATAFTHPRRVEIVRALRAGSLPTPSNGDVSLHLTIT